MNQEQPQVGDPVQVILRHNTNSYHHTECPQSSCPILGQNFSAGNRRNHVNFLHPQAKLKRFWVGDLCILRGCVSISTDKGGRRGGGTGPMAPLLWSKGSNISFAPPFLRQPYDLFSFAINLCVQINDEHDLPLLAFTQLQVLNVPCCRSIMFCACFTVICATCR